MGLSKPYKRTCRQLADGSYSNNGHWQYLLHPDYVKNPQHYIRAFEIIQDDFINLLKYVEPCENNLDTISLIIHQLLMRVCVEIEANFTAILLENGFQLPKGDKNLSIKHYLLINHTHKLSSYKASLPIWIGNNKIRAPFVNWDNNGGLSWYQAYNKSKHDRYNHFEKASFENLYDAICALVILLSAQFKNEDYSLKEANLSLCGYNYKPESNLPNTALGGFFRVEFPDDWDLNERYDFNWQVLKNDKNPISTFDYNKLLYEIQKEK
jgi:hypothetical protein